MPEGPEVKIASDFLNNTFEKQVIIKVEVLTEYFEKKYFEVFQSLRESLIGKEFHSFTIGKNTFIKLNHNSFYNYHLGMTGSWIESHKKHCHFKISSEKNTLYFMDVRKFGNHKIVNQETLLKNYNIAFDSLNKDYNLKEHFKFLKNKINTSKNICTILMNQKYFPGVGNYIKSEVLFANKIHPQTNWGMLNDRKINLLLQSTKEIMYDSYLHGGAELKDFKNPFNKSEFTLKVYGQNFDPQGNKIEKTTTKDQRSTWWSPKIQKLKI